VSVVVGVRIVVGEHVVVFGDWGGKKKMNMEIKE